MISVIFLFGCFVIVSSLALSLCTLVSALVDPPELVVSMGIAALIMGFVGGGIVLAFKGREKRLQRAESYFLCVVVWFAGPLVLSTPVLLLTKDASWLSVYADAVSALTTTGTSFVPSSEGLSVGLQLWRAMMGWIGGLSALAMIVIVLAPTKVGGLVVGMSHAPEHRVQSQWDRIVRMMTKVAPIYGGITIALFLAFQLAGATAIESLSLAMGTISTSGIGLSTGDLAAYGGAGIAWVAIVGMLIGGLGFVWLAVLLRFGGEGIGGLWESIFALILIVALAAIAGIGLYSGALGAAGLTIMDAAREGLLSAVSLVTTTGYDVRPGGVFVFPFVLVLFVTAFGGVTVSTAGGIKIFRLMAMFQQAGRELSRLIYPHRVLAMRVGGQVYDIQLMKAIWSAFAVYVATVSAIALVLSYDMPSYIAALTAATALVSTAGPVYEAAMDVSTGLPHFSTLSIPSKLAMIAAMILGRLEILAVLTLMNIRLVRA